MCPHLTKNYNNIIFKNKNDIVALNIPIIIRDTHIKRNRNVKYFTILISESVYHHTLKNVLNNNTINQNQQLLNLKQSMKNEHFQKIIFLQIFQAFYTLNNVLGVQHLDNHSGNIIIHQTIPGNYQTKYSITDSDNNPIHFYLPNIGWTVKVIDYDGSVKFPRYQLNNILKNSVGNPELKKMLSLNNNVFVNNHISNMYKLMKPLFNNRKYGLNGKFGFFSKQAIEKLSNNPIDLLRVQNMFNTSTAEFNLLKTYHLPLKYNIVSKRWSRIPFPDGVLKGYDTLIDAMKDQFKQIDHMNVVSHFDTRKVRNLTGFPNIISVTGVPNNIPYINLQK